MNFLKPFLILFFYTFYSYAQIELKGVIKDSSNSVIAFANVVLTNQKNEIVKGTITDEKGEFILSAKKGKYEISISFLGYKDWVKEISVDNSYDFGIIILEESKNSLDEVVVTARKPLIERKVDRLIFNVDNSIAVVGGNGLDALKLTPRVKVQNDEISVIGKNNLAVMINGRIVQMSGEDLANYLKSLNSEDIKSIEVITNPPAKYSAEGNSGLVNIILKKPKNEAWNVSLRTIYQQATYAKGNIGGSFNMQKEKFQLSAAISYTNGSNAPQETNKVYYPNLTWDEVNNRRDFTDALSIRLGLEYKINDKFSTGLSYNFVSSQPLIKEIDQTNLTSLSNNIADSTITTLGRNQYDKKLQSLNYHFIYNIDTIGRKLSLDFDYFNFKNETNRIFSTQSFLPNNQPISNSLEEARNFGNQDIQNYSLNIDVECSLDWFTINYGGRISFTETDNLFNYFDILNGEEILNSNFSNQFNYKEDTQALYFSAQKSFSEKWEAKIGLRHEFTQTEGFSKTLNQTNTNNYSKLFPTVYVAYTSNDNHSFSVNYGRRISRPSFGLLNPFRFVNNPFSFSEGNPFLQPAFTDNFEFGYSYKDKLITNIYHSQTDDDFEQVTIIEEDTKIQRVIPLNFIVNKMFGITQTFIFKPIKWLNVNASADVYYSDTNSKIPETLQQLSGWSGVFQISNDFNINPNKTILFNISYAYITKGVSNLDTNSNANQLDTSFKWLLLDKKLVISMYANDLLSSNRFTYTSFSNDIKNSFRNYYDERYFRIGLIYNFGKSFRVDKRENKNQEEKDRTN